MLGGDSDALKIVGNGGGEEGWQLNAFEAVLATHFFLALTKHVGGEAQVRAVVYWSCVEGGVVGVAVFYFWDEEL